MAERRVPVGRLGRLVRMAGVGARTGASLILSSRSESAAERAAEVLGTLRGLATKVGQMMSYVDGLLPEAQREVFERAMQPLQADAPSTSPEAVSRMIERELGGKVKDLFADFDLTPFASASIGQVHRARLFDGRTVAVKVQHPRIDEAMENDLDNAGIVEALVSGLGPRVMNARAVFEEVRRRFREELDYTLEAERQRFFADIHAGDPLIHVPRVIDECSSRRVLTAEFVSGATLEQAAEMDENLRRRYAETLWRFVFKGNLIGGMFNADPHPGNYLFHPDGGITFLDFGCVQPLDPTHMLRARRVHHAALQKDLAAFERRIAELLGLRGGEYQRAALEYCLRCFDPLLLSPFRVTRPYVSDLVGEIQKLKKFMFAKDKSFVPLPANMVFMNRLQFGFYSVLARLDVAADYAAVERSFLAEAGWGFDALAQPHSAAVMFYDRARQS
jgi:predicted unusual protein kinase regulating ubiquinone biosynthesis (AarF/ABC1/UbiB family)